MLVSAYKSAISPRAVGDEGFQVVTRLDLLFGSQQLGTATAIMQTEQWHSDITKEKKDAAT